jgi:DNA gyrase subunit A
MFVSTTHHWILFFTNKGRVYRAKAYQLPDSGRDARGQHVANLLAFQPDEEIAQVLAMPDFESSDYLVMATRKGLVKKTKLSEYDKNRQGGIIAINLTDDDELIAARQVSESDDLLLVSRKGMSARFTADDETLRPMGRATSGVIGMRFRGDDALLAMDVVQDDAYVVTITDGGYAKRTPVAEWAPKGRGILGVRAMKLVEERGSLVGAMVCQENDELFAIASNGIVIRTRVGEVRPSGRDTMGVTLMNLAEGDSIVAVARGGESSDDDDDLEGTEEAVVEGGESQQEPGEPTESVIDGGAEAAE